MKNCIITGFGRSGTSLMAGLLHEAGYYVGDHLYPPRLSNPKGFYEDKEINYINEVILSAYDGLEKKDNRHDYKLFSPYNPRFGHRWLSYIPVDSNVECNDLAIIKSIIAYSKRNPFAYKDPRFCFTLDVWKKYLDADVIIIVMLRNPFHTVESVLKECQSVNYLKDFAISRQLALDLWINYYERIHQHIINESKHKYRVVQYEDILSGGSVSAIADVINAPLKTDFVDLSLNRSSKVVSEAWYSDSAYNKCLFTYNKIKAFLANN